MENKIRNISVLIFILLLLPTTATAFATNGTQKIFSFTVSSSRGQASSGNFSTGIITGGIASPALSSSNFKTELGFLRTTGYVIGEACDTNQQCVSGVCCSGVCSTRCEGPPAPPTPHTSSGSGAGGAPIAEPIQEGSYLRFWDLIKSNEEIALSLDKIELPVIKLIFRVNQDLEAVSISIIPIKNQEITIANAYQYFELKSNKVNSNNILSFIIRFRVNADSGYLKETISLNKYSNSDWIKLPTKLIEEDSKYHYYESITNGLSLFVITGEKVLVEAPKPPEVETTPKLEESIAIAKENATAPQIASKEIAEEKKENKLLIITFFGLASIAVLVTSAMAARHIYRKVRYEHLKKIYYEFYSLLSKVHLCVSGNMLREAYKAYYKLLSDYKELAKAPIKTELKLHIYEEIKRTYDELHKNNRTVTIK